MSGSQQASDPQQVQMSVPVRGAYVHRTVSLVELAMVTIGVLALLGALSPLVK
jgi:hypothetical protein